MTSNLVKTFNGLTGYKWDHWTLWVDFVEMMAISLSNAVDIVHATKREERYLQIVNKYSKDELDIFSKMYADLVIDLEQNPRDVLGEVFMELGLGNKWRGQFFTPYPTAYIMAKNTLPVDDIQRLVDEKGFVTVGDNACGGGVTLIAAFNWILEAGFNPQQMLVLEGGDIDKRSCCMSYVQLSLLGANAVIRERDGLAPQSEADRDTWFTPFYILGAWKAKQMFGFSSKPKVMDLPVVANENGQLGFDVSEVS